MGNFHRQLNQTVKRHCHATVGSGFTESFVKTFTIFSCFSDVPFWADVYFKFMQLGLFLLFDIDINISIFILLRACVSPGSLFKFMRVCGQQEKPDDVPLHR